MAGLGSETCMLSDSLASAPDADTSVGVSLLMPCLDEARWLPACIANARAALEMIHAKLALTGEIIIADNDSTDGSREVAQSLGVAVVLVDEPGYGAALT